MTTITFQINNARDIHLAIDQLRAIEGTVPQDVTVTYQTAQAGACEPQPREGLTAGEILDHFHSSDYEFRTAGGLFDDIGCNYASKDNLTKQLNELVGNGYLRTARRSRDGATLYAIA